MYSDYFGFQDKPFNLTPDPRFFYSNTQYGKVYVRLAEAIRRRQGFILLTGDVGNGKTTLLLKLIKDLESEIRLVFFPSTNLSFSEFVSFTCDQLGLGDKHEQHLDKVEALSEFLAEQHRGGQTTALLIDEAQNLTDDALENLPFLSNLETMGHALLQIVLVGPPEFERRLKQPRLCELDRKIRVRCRLERLQEAEVDDFIRHRLRAVGYERDDILTPEAVERIAAYSNGSPRRINALCGNAFLSAYSASQSEISAEIVEEVAGEVGPRVAMGSNPDQKTHEATAPDRFTHKEVIGRTPEPPTSVDEPIAELGESELNDTDEAGYSRQTREGELESSIDSAKPHESASEIVGSMKAGLSPLKDKLPHAWIVRFYAGVEYFKGGYCTLKERYLHGIMIRSELWVRETQMRLRSLKSEIVRRRTLWIGGTAGLLALILVVGLVSRDDDRSPQPAVSSLELDEQLASQDKNSLTVAQAPQTLQQIGELSELLSHERTAAAQLREGLDQVSRDLQSYMSVRDELTTQLLALSEEPRLGGSNSRSGVATTAEQLAVKQSSPQFDASESVQTEQLKALRKERDELAQKLEALTIENEQFAATMAQRDAQTTQLPQPTIESEEVSTAGEELEVAVAAEDTQPIQSIESPGETQVSQVAEQSAVGSVDAPTPTLHVVSKGDTLWDISTRYGVSVAQVAAWNNIDSRAALQPGQSLSIHGPSSDRVPPAAPSSSQVSSSQEDSGKTVYTVRRGDSLYQIAKRFNVSVAQLRQWNDLSEAQPIQPNQRLTVFSDAADVTGAEVADAASENEFQSELVTAARSGDLLGVQKLLAQGVDVNTKDKDGTTPLMWAADKGHTQVLKELLDRGAEVNARNSAGEVALMYAVWSGHAEGVELLLSRGSDVNSTNNSGEIPLMYAAWHGHKAIVLELLDKNADMSARNTNGWNAITYAATVGHRDIVAALLERGSDPNSRSNTGETVLATAAWNGHADIVHLLLDQGADVNALDENSWSALMKAAWNGHTPIVEELLARNADVNVQNTSGQTAAMVAESQGHEEIVQMLKQAGTGGQSDGRETAERAPESQSS